MLSLIVASVESRRQRLTERFFRRSVLRESSCLHYMLPDKRDSVILDWLRHAETFTSFPIRNEKFVKSFIPYCLNRYKQYICSEFLGFGLCTRHELTLSRTFAISLCFCFLKTLYCIVIITGSIARSASRRYLVYSEADYEVVRPAGATRCIDAGEIWHGPPCQISPPSVQRQGCRTPKIEIFTQIWQKCGI